MEREISKNHERIHSLDAVRSFALLLGVVIHVSLPFLPVISYLGFPFADKKSSFSLNIVLFVIHIFRMAVFFIIAGFFANLLIQKRGTAEFIRNRKKRILLPLLVFIIPVTLGLLVPFIFGEYNPPGDIPENIKREASKNIIPFPLGHLWFLYILVWTILLGLCCYACYVIILCFCEGILDSCL